MSYKVDYMDALNRVFASKARDFDNKDAAIWGGTGAILAGLIGYYRNRKEKSIPKRTLKTLLWMLGGGAAGAYSYNVKQNLIDQLGGYWDRSEYIARNNATIVPSSDTKTPPQHYVIYVGGAYEHPESPSNLPSAKELDKNVRVVTFPWAASKEIQEFKDKLRPKDTADIISFSAGFTSARDLDTDKGHAINNMVHLDPVDLNMFRRAWHHVVQYTKPSRLKDWQIQLPNSVIYGENASPVIINRLGYQPQANNRITGTSHSMNESTYKPSESRTLADVANNLVRDYYPEN